MSWIFLLTFSKISSRKGKDMKNYITGSRYGQELADLRKSQGVPKSERNQLKKEEQIAKRK